MTNTNTTTTTPPCSSSSSSTCSSPVLVSGVPADSASEDDADLASSSPSPPLTEEPPVDNDNDDINDDDDDTTEKTKTKQSVNVNESTNPTVATTTASRLSPSSILLQWYRTWFHDWRQNHHHHHHTSTTTTTMNAVGRQCHDALTFYVQFMTLSPSHPDKILKFLQYTFYMVSQALIWHDHRPQRQQARPNIATAQWLDKLYQEFTWARYILRIVQFPVALDAAWHQSWTLTAAPGNDDDPLTLLLPSRHCHRRRQSIYNVLGRILTYSMVVYYPTELMAYLLWMKPKAPPNETTTMSELTTTLVPSSSSSSLTTTTLHHHCHPQQSPHGSIVSLLYHVVTTWRDTLPPSSSSSGRRSFPRPETWSYLSCRCWLIYIVTELIQSYVQYQELTTTTTTTALPTLVDPSKQQQQRRHILLQSLRNLLFLLPCTAWSMSKWDSQPILSSRTVNTLLWFESIVSLYQAVQQQRTTTTSPLSPPVIATTQPE